MNPSTANPLTSQSHSKIIAAFITKRNKPNVKIVTGNANNFKMGLMKVFSIASTIATIIRVITPEDEPKGGRYTPGLIHAERAIAKHDNINFVRVFIMCCLH